MCVLNSKPIAQVESSAPSISTVDEANQQTCVAKTEVADVSTTKKSIAADIPDAVARVAEDQTGALASAELQAK